jgi:hypothetical protein
LHYYLKRGDKKLLHQNIELSAYDITQTSNQQSLSESGKSGLQ